MELGLNLSFAVKRWMTPESLGELLGGLNDRHGVTHFQFSFDQLEPWWPTERRATIAAAYRKELEAVGITLDSAFGGIVGYTAPNLLAPLQEQRDSGLELFKRSLDTALELGTTVYGSPLGGMDSVEAHDPALRAERYQQVVEAYHRLADYAAEVGITELMVEPTPVEKELLHTTDACLQFARDVADAAVPVTFLVDWGHAICAPFGTVESMKTWLDALGDHIGALHLQQTDGLADRHWPFDHDGVITNELITSVAEETGTGDLVQYIEYIPLFEDFDATVLDAVEATLSYLKGSFGD